MIGQWSYLGVFLLLGLVACQPKQQASTAGKAKVAEQAKTVAAEDTKSIEREQDELTFDTCRRATLAKIDNLRLEDRINELQGRPKGNSLAIAKLENTLMYEDMLRSEEVNDIKQEALVAKGAADVFPVLHEPFEAMIDAVVAARMANATGSEADRKAALANLDATREKLKALIAGLRDKGQKGKVSTTQEQQ